MIDEKEITRGIELEKEYKVGKFLKKRKMEIEKRIEDFWRERDKMTADESSKLMQELEDLKGEYKILLERSINDLFYNGSGDLKSSVSQVYLEPYQID